LAEIAVDAVSHLRDLPHEQVFLGI